MSISVGTTQFRIPDIFFRFLWLSVDLAPAHFISFHFHSFDSGSKLKWVRSWDSCTSNMAFLMWSIDGHLGLVCHTLTQCWTWFLSSVLWSEILFSISWRSCPCVSSSSHLGFNLSLNISSNSCTHAEIGINYLQMNKIKLFLKTMTLNIKSIKMWSREMHVHNI